MTSASYHHWLTVRAAALDDVEAALSAVGGSGRGRRLALQQVNRAYVVLLSAEFQGFCRDLHNECSEHFISLVPVAVQDVVRLQFLSSRLIDRGNPNPGNIGADVNRFGIKFWAELGKADLRTVDDRRELEKLNEWRNAIAHHEYDPHRLGGTIVLRVRQVRGWRWACDRLARTFDTVLRQHLGTVTGVLPW